MESTKDLVDKIGLLERKVAEEKGNVLFFALVHRDDLLDSWDLVVAAPWASEDRRKTLDYLFGMIKSMFGPGVLLRLARIFILDANNPEVRAYSEELRAHHGKAEVHNGEFFGLLTREAYVIASQPVAA